MHQLSNQAVALLENYQQTGHLEHLEDAIRTMEQALELGGAHIEPVILINLAAMLGIQFQRTDSTDTLNRAVDVINMAVDATPQDHPNRAELLNNFRRCLDIRFRRTGSIDDLDRLIDVTSTALHTIPQDHPDRAQMLDNLGNWLTIQSERTGSIDNLNRAVDIISAALNATPQGHSNRAAFLKTFGNSLGTRFQRTGSMDDLNCAVDSISTALDIIPEDHTGRAGLLDSLGTWLGLRFERTGSMDDLNRAIDVTSMAANVNITTQDHTSRAGRLNNLGNWIGRRFERTGSINDLNRAVNAATMAVDIIPHDHPGRAIILNNLGDHLAIRFQVTGSIDALNRAIDVTSMAVNVNITPYDQAKQAGFLHNLSMQLSMRFKRTGSINDLTRAVDTASIAINITPHDHPDRADRLRNFGDLLGTQSQRTNSINDLNHRLLLYKEGWSCNNAPTPSRIRLARAAANILASQQKWDESSQLLEEAVKLLPTLSPRSLNHTDKQHMLAESAGLASMAAAIALKTENHPSHALQLLELGRGIIASLLMDMRADISNLHYKHPDLAHEFTLLRNELDSPLNRSISIPSNATSWESQKKRRREVEQGFDKLIARIHAKPGFERFLLPPAQDEIMAAADPDPIVIINLSSYRCDAFLIEHNRIMVLELPGLTTDEVQERVRSLRLSRKIGSWDIKPLLEWLWISVTGPILDTLGFKGPVSDDKWRRVWWIPTGLLSQLPLHAAGRYMQGSTETVLDRVMSSYALSVKALIHGRRHPIRKSTRPFADFALLAAMRTTPDLAANQMLPFVGDEVEMVKNICPSLQQWSLKPIMRKDHVLQHLKKCKIFHFAGHGLTNQVDPSRSSLLLEDWKTNPLTVGDLRDHRFQENGPFLGYLSACSTGSNEVVRLADEGIHLISAFQLAGFRHVVGTLWEVSDKHCVDVAKVFYETLRDEGMTDLAVCRGLHRAVRALRYRVIEGEKVKNEKEKDEKGRDAKLVLSGSHVQNMADPYWVPYIHFGV